MNTKYPQAPEVISAVSEIDTDGNETSHGDHVTGIEVYKDDKGAGTARIELRGWGKRGDAFLQITIELPELATAIAQATLHAQS